MSRRSTSPDSGTVTLRGMRAVASAFLATVHHTQDSRAGKQFRGSKYFLEMQETKARCIPYNFHTT